MAADFTAQVEYASTGCDDKCPDGLHQHVNADRQSTPVHGRRPKDPSPSAKLNLFSRLCLCWLDPLFWLGFRRTLEQTDLYSYPKEADSERLLRRFNKYCTQETDHNRRGTKPRLWLAMLKCMWWWILLQGISLLIQNIVLLSQPIIVGYLVDYFTTDNPTSVETRNAYLLATGLMITGLFLGLNNAHIFLQAAKFGMMMRVMSTAAIYQKILRLSQVTIGQTSTGHIINLASNDVQRFDKMFDHYHYLWIGPLQWIFITVWIYSEVGWTVFLAVGCLILQFPLQLCLAKVFSKLRFRSARMTDQRIKVMNEIITGIRVIKMYGWEYAFRRVVAALRRKESVIILQSMLLQGLTIVLTFVGLYCTLMFLIFVPFVSTGGELSAKGVITSIALLNLVRLSIYLIMDAVFRVSEGIVGIRRIQKLLELDEITDIAASTGTSARFTLLPLSDGKTSPFVKVTNFSTSWSYDSGKLVLENITFTMGGDFHILAVVGPVGSGKSSMLQCLLGELQPLQGSIDVCGRVSYASQEPWVFSGTVRENVLFGLPYQRDWYLEVVEACALCKDIELLVDGDLTLVGERGVTLSGGQKARVTLARAVYRNADIYLLDDPLSAVDTSVARHLFEKYYISN